MPGNSDLKPANRLQVEGMMIIYPETAPAEG
jgi:hypothetical protein